MTAFPKPARIKVLPRHKLPHRFQRPHDDPGPGPCWFCMKPRSAKVHQPRKPIQAKRWGVSRSARGTAHGRRERDFGRMAFLSGLEECAAKAWLSSLPHSYLLLMIGVGFPGCLGRLEVAHLSLGKTAGRRRAPDAQTAPLCHQHHTDIDGKIGGQGRWYAGLGYDGQQELRRWIIDWATAKWEAIGKSERDAWRRRAAPERSEGR